MELTEEERAEIEKVLSDSRFMRDQFPVLSSYAAEQYGDLNALGQAWAQLTSQGRQFVGWGLAAQADGNPEFMAYDLSDLLDDPTLNAPRRGRPIEPGLRAVVHILFRCWVNRKNKPEIGALQRHERQKASPACRAIADHILDLFPTRFTALDPEDRRAEAERQVDSQLRALRKSRLI